MATTADKKKRSLEQETEEEPAGDGTQDAAAAATSTEPDVKKAKLEEGHGDDDGGAEGEGQQEQQQQRRRRHRKRHKKVYKSIVDQMSFYFSDANLNKSKFMTDELAKHGPWLKLETFLKFNKLAEMLKLGFEGRVCVDDLWAALKAIPSDAFEVREGEGEGGAIKEIKRRKEGPLTKDPEVTEKCTVYVENLPPFVSIDSLRNLFSKYGKVDYVSLPRYKHNMAIKGFAFVEFSEEDGAKAAVEKAEPETLIDPTAKDPAQLQTVKSYNKEKAIEKGLVDPDLEEEEEEEGQTTPEKGQGDDDSKDNEGEDEDEDEEDNQKQNTRRRHKKPHHQKGHQKENEGHLMTSLRIMSKTDWRRLRNKYLNLQKRNMSMAKGKIRQMQAIHDRKSGAGSQSPTEPEPEQPEEQTELQPVEAAPASKVPERNGGVDFVAGVIVRFALNEPVIENGKAFKARIKAAVMEPVKYVDAANGSLVMHVRCANAKQAETISGAGKGIVGVPGDILQGQDEADYWAKIQKDRSDKVGGKVKVAAAKVRGKDRVVKKFETTVRNTHRFFEEDE